MAHVLASDPPPQDTDTSPLRRCSWWPHSTFFELHPPPATQPVIHAERVIDRLAADGERHAAA